MVEDVVEVVVVTANMVGIAADVVEGEIGIGWICNFSMVVEAKLLEPVVQVIWPIVSMKPSATNAEAGMMTILFSGEAVRTPLPGAPLSTKAGQYST